MPSPDNYVTDLVHEPTQLTDNGVDLTVSNVYEVTEPGRIDFGGGELEPAGVLAHETAKRNPDDDYEWWSLSAGQYLLTHNESLTGEKRLTVQPRTELLERGATHPTVTVSELPKLPLSVGGAGLKLKENARVSTVVGVEE
jgi:deoxycytidine triphosphate deaminase